MSEFLTQLKEYFIYGLYVLGAIVVMIMYVFIDKDK